MSPSSLLWMASRNHFIRYCLIHRAVQFDKPLTYKHWSRLVYSGINRIDITKQYDINDANKRIRKYFDHNFGGLSHLFLWRQKIHVHSILNRVRRTPISYSSEMWGVEYSIYYYFCSFRIQCISWILLFYLKYVHFVYKNIRVKISREQL